MILRRLLRNDQQSFIKTVGEQRLNKTPEKELKNKWQPALDSLFTNFWRGKCIKYRRLDYEGEYITQIIAYLWLKYAHTLVSWRPRYDHNIDLPQQNNLNIISFTFKTEANECTSFSVRDSGNFPCWNSCFINSTLADWPEN